MNDNELQHWGVKGQKWGVRRYQNADGSLTLAGRYHQYKTRKKRKAAMKKAAETKAANKAAAEKRAKDLAEGRIKLKDMTDAEIRQKIDRMQLEQNYSKLELSTSSAAKGKKFVMEVLEASGKNIATQLTTYGMGALVNEVVKSTGYTNATRTIKDEDGTERIERIFEDVVNPRKGQKDK